MVWHITNEAGNKSAYAGTEGGTVPSPVTHQWRGDLTVTKTANIVRKEEATGGYDRYQTVALDTPTITGTYAESLSFQSLAIHSQYAFKTGDTGVLVPTSTGAYRYRKAPSPAIDDIDSATVVYGVDGLAWQSTGVRHDEFTITIDADDTEATWQFSSNLAVGSKDDLPPVIDGVATGGTATTITMTGAAWTVDELAGRYVFLNFGSHTGDVRMITANTATEITVDEAFDTIPSAGDVFRVEANMPVVAVMDDELIKTSGTEFYLDDLDTALGTTQVMDRVISFNMTVRSNRTTKKFLETPEGQTSRRSGRGAREVTGQFRLELDRRDEFWAWINKQERGLMIRQTGTEIDTGITHEAVIEIPRIAFETPTEDTRENNMTVTVPFVGFLHPTEDIFTIDVVNDLPTLP